MKIARDRLKALGWAKKKGLPMPGGVSPKEVTVIAGLAAALAESAARGAGASTRLTVSTF
jgi:hypothetical protein